MSDEQPMSDEPAMPPLPSPAADAAPDPRVGELEEQLHSVQAELVGARDSAGDLELALQVARGETLAATRRALLAEHAGQVVPELVQGESAQELEASVALAREAFERIVGDLRLQAAAQVPVGASAAVGQTPEELSPMQKITAALSRNGR